MTKALHCENCGADLSGVVSYFWGALLGRSTCKSCGAKFRKTTKAQTKALTVEGEDSMVMRESPEPGYCWSCETKFVNAIATSCLSCGVTREPPEPRHCESCGAKVVNDEASSCSSCGKNFSRHIDREGPGLVISAKGLAKAIGYSFLAIVILSVAMCTVGLAVDKTSGGLSGRPSITNDEQLLVDAQRSVTEAGFPVVRAMTEFYACETDTSCSQAASRFEAALVPYVPVLESAISVLNSADSSLTRDLDWFDDYKAALQIRLDAFLLYLEALPSRNERLLSAADEKWEEAFKASIALGDRVQKWLASEP